MLDETSVPTAYYLVSLFGQSYAKIHPYLAVPVCIFSLLTNVLTFVVLSKKDLRSAINCLLRAVAVCHLLLHSLYLGSIVHDWFYIVDDCPCDSHIFTFSWTLIVLVFSHLSFTLHGIGTWLTVAMAVLRCVQLKTRDNSYAKPVVATKAIVGVVVFVVSCCVPNYVAFSVSKVPMENACPSHIVGPTDDAEMGGWVITASQISYEWISHPFRMAFQLSAILFYIIPCCLLIVGFCYLVSTLSQFDKTRKRLQQNMTLSCTHIEHHTVMLVSILAVFVVTQLPQGVLTFLCSVLSENYRLEVYQSLGQVMELMSIINGLFGFLLYCSMSTLFRSTFISLFARVETTAARRADMSSVDNVVEKGCGQCRDSVSQRLGYGIRNSNGQCQRHATAILHTTQVGSKGGRWIPHVLFL